MNMRTLRICRLFFWLLIYPLAAHAGLPLAENVPGGLAVVPLVAVSDQPDSHKPQAWLGDVAVLVMADHGLWYAVVGLSLDRVPGSYELRVDNDGVSRQKTFIVGDKKYPEQHLTLKDKGKVELSPENLARAERDIAAIKNLKLHRSLAADNDLDFVLPAQGALSSRFGLRRYFNEQARAPHVGLDVVVPVGTPVHASAAGVVLATDDYFFNGKTVFIDHGNGLITLYCHLSRFDVRPGQHVDKDQALGLSGMTGRATGPHLHWSVVLNGAMVNPELFLAQPSSPNPGKPYVH